MIGVDHIAAEVLSIKEQLKARQEARITKLLPKIIETAPVEIGVYGSYARGDYKATSDVDLYALYERLPSPIDKGELYEEAADIGIDLLICTYETFYASDSIFTKNVIQDRKILWMRTERHEE